MHDSLDSITSKPSKHYGKLSGPFGLACYSYLKYKKIDESLNWYITKKHEDSKYEPSTFSELSAGERRNCQGDAIQKRFDAIKSQYILDEDDHDYASGSEYSESDDE